MKENKTTESTFSKLWNNKRTHALMVLGVWFIFFFVIILLMNGLSSNQRPKEIIPLETKWIELKKNNYSFVYRISINNEISIYSGEQNDKIVMGLKDTNSGTMKYYIDDNIYYKVLLDNYEVIDNVYENVDINLINVNYIYDLIKDISENKIGNVTTYNLDNYSIEVTENDEIITNIKINLDESIYDLTFGNIGKSTLSRIEVTKSDE